MGKQQLSNLQPHHRRRATQVEKCSSNLLIAPLTVSIWT